MVLRLSSEVSEALARGSPVVALESALVTHGLPHPHNIDTALGAERAVRELGAIPATVAVLAGEVRVGLSEDEMRFLASPDASPDKLSLRDLGPASEAGSTGGTTVAATVHIAHRAGIAVFATGGLGGVHRGAEATWDVSPDLLALRDASIVVICSGVKSILDARATLEGLETASVAVVAYGSNRLPGFYVADAGLAASWRLDSPQQVAQAFLAARVIGHRGALVVANPPDPKSALGAREHDELLRAALEEAEARGITGKDVTPFVLGEMARRSDGRTLAANRDLVVRNAALAARVATALRAATGGPRRP